MKKQLTNREIEMVTQGQVSESLREIINRLIEIKNENEVRKSTVNAGLKVGDLLFRCEQAALNIAYKLVPLVPMIGVAQRIHLLTSEMDTHHLLGFESQHSIPDPQIFGTCHHDVALQESCSLNAKCVNGVGRFLQLIVKSP